MIAPSRSTEAPPKESRLDRTLFEQLCAARDAETEDERAALIGVDRGTIRRWVRGDVSPRLVVARQTARILDTTVDELWKDDQQ